MKRNKILVLPFLHPLEQRTRAEVLLERACVKRPGTSDVLENARQWNVPVWSLAKLLKWLSALKQSERYRPPRATHGTTTSTPTGRTNTTTTSSTHSSSLTKVQRLRDPFIKTESFSRLLLVLSFSNININGNHLQYNYYATW